MKTKKKFYAYFISKKKQGICESWNECEKMVKGVKNAKFQSFKTNEEADEWLKAGAKYKEAKIYPCTKWTPLSAGIYFDSGTGRGKGVEISVTAETGKDLLIEILNKKIINRFGKHLIKEKVTNNYGELLACKYALQLAIKNKIKKIFGDSNLIIKYWSKGFFKKNMLPKKTIDLINEVMELRKRFENKNGEIIYISGDDNPADLGFHK